MGMFDGFFGKVLLGGLAGGIIGGGLQGVGAGAAVGGAVGYKEEIDEATDKLEAEGKRQKKEQDDLLKEAKDKLKADEDAKANSALGAISAHRARAARAGNSRGGTILTSPLGLIGGPTGVRKTLLGQ